MHRIVIGLRWSMAFLLLAAGALKLFAGAPLVSEAMRMLALSEQLWPNAANALQAIGVLELAVGCLLISGSAVTRWGLLVVVVLAGFAVWDAARWATGGPPDCGCFGPVRIASAWWHVLAKQVLLWTVLVCIWRGGRPAPSRVPA